MNEHDKTGPAQLMQRGLASRPWRAENISSKSVLLPAILLATFSLGVRPVNGSIICTANDAAAQGAVVITEGQNGTFNITLKNDGSDTYPNDVIQEVQCTAVTTTGDDTTDKCTVTAIPWVLYSGNLILQNNGTPIKETAGALNPAVGSFAIFSIPVYSTGNPAGSDTGINTFNVIVSWYPQGHLGMGGNCTIPCIVTVRDTDAPVPEPSTLIIWALLGTFAITVSRWRRSKAA